MQNKNKVNIKIAGSDYSLCGEDSPEYMQKLAVFVDKRIQEMMKRTPLLSVSMASVLVSLNFADELFKMREALVRLDEEKNRLSTGRENLEKDIKALTEEVHYLSELNNVLLDELSGKKTKPQDGAAPSPPKQTGEEGLHSESASEKSEQHTEDK